MMQNDNSPHCSNHILAAERGEDAPRLRALLHGIATANFVVFAIALPVALRWYAAGPTSAVDVLSAATIICSTGYATVLLAAVVWMHVRRQPLPLTHRHVAWGWVLPLINAVSGAVWTVRVAGVLWDVSWIAAILWTAVGGAVSLFWALSAGLQLTAGVRRTTVVGRDGE